MAKSVSPRDIETTRTNAMVVKQLDMTAGGGEAVHQMASASREAQALWRQPCSTSLAQDRDTAVAWVMNDVAWALHDAGGDGRASVLWHYAAQAARDAHNWSLTTRIYGQIARQRLQMRQPQQCLDLILLAAENDERQMLTATELAMLWALRARAHAAMADAKGTDVAVHNALSYWSKRKRSGDMDDRPWSGHFDEAHLYGDLAAAWSALLDHGARVATNALGDYDHALALQHPNNRRTRVLQELGRAHVDIKYGDLERGVMAAIRALDVGRVASSRVVASFGRVSDAMLPFCARIDVRVTRDRIIETVGLREAVEQR